MIACPACNNPMVSGYVEVRDTWSDFFFWGLSYLVLHFLSSLRNADVEVLRPGVRLESFGCPDCGTVAITRRSWIP